VGGFHIRPNFQMRADIKSAPTPYQLLYFILKNIHKQYIIWLLYELKGANYFEY